MTDIRPAERGIGEASDSGRRLFVSLHEVTMAFGATLANAQISLDVHEGDVIGLVGGNGAGKSTLMRILCGALRPTLGAIAFGDGKPTNFVDYDTAAAQRRGVRMVHQEFSLCANLSIAENFFVEAPADTLLAFRWRAPFRRRAREAIQAVFPGAAIDVDAPVGRLSIGERQMVEIARAVATPGVRLIVLDEPTSSLDPERSRQLRAFIRERSRRGLAFIFISHKLYEIIDISAQIVVLRNGRVAWKGAATDASIGRLVERMGGDAAAIQHYAETGRVAAGEGVLRIGGRFTRRLGREIGLHKGEIVGLAGLEGCGQKDLLHAILNARREGGDIARSGDASFIAGDRRKEGVFPLSSVLFNVAIGPIARRAFASLVSMAREARAMALFAEEMQLDPGRFSSNILELSGGNQQKALVARALATGTTILLLDDPTRGVDIATKQDFYRLCNQAAQTGRTLVWHTTEDAELLAADRVLVFADGEVVRELAGSDLTEQAVVGASFASASDRRKKSGEAAVASDRMFQALSRGAPFLSLALVFAIMIWANPAVASVFGLDLLLTPAIPLVLVAMAQMYVVGGSEIDLGVGAFAGLTSVLAATLLHDEPPLGVAAIAGTAILYSGLGWLIHARRIPAIVVTLGASFIWSGLGYSLQPTPGGASPDWLTASVNWSLFGLPTPVLLILAVALIALVLNELPLGVALRGFGANTQAMVNSGWSATRYASLRYLIAWAFAMAAGLALTGINTASDINAGNSYTLLSVAGVVMGGCALIGGEISPLGAAAGAVTLSLIGALLGTLNISSDFNVAAQGLVLITLLAIRALATRRRVEE